MVLVGCIRLGSYVVRGPVSLSRGIAACGAILNGYVVLRPIRLRFFSKPLSDVVSCVGCRSCIGVRDPC